MGETEVKRPRQPRAKGARKVGNPKGSKRTPRKGAQYLGNKTQAQAYKEFLDNGELSSITPDDISTCIAIIRNRKGVGKYQYVEDLQFCIKAYWDFIAVNWQNGVNLIPDYEGCCSFLGIARSTARDWEIRNFRNFGETLAMLRTDIASAKKQLALQGKIPPTTFAIDFNNNHDYVQKQDVVIRTQTTEEQLSTDALKAKYLSNTRVSQLETRSKASEAPTDAIDAEFVEVKAEK